MPKFDFSVGSFLVGTAFAIFLIVLDKAGKLKGPMLLVLLAVSALLTLPLALNADWVSNAHGLAKFSRVFLMLCVVGVGYALIAIWVTADGESETAKTENGKASAAIKEELPDFKIGLGQLASFYQKQGDKTLILMEVQIANFGAPSVAINWEIHYKSSSLEIDARTFDVVDEPLQLRVPGHPSSAILKHYNVDSIHHKTSLAPLIRGVPVAGRLPFWLPGNRQDEMSAGGVVITVTAHDWLGNPFVGFYQSDPNSDEQKLNLLPGDKVVPDRGKKKKR